MVAIRMDAPEQRKGTIYEVELAQEAFNALRRGDDLQLKFISPNGDILIIQLEAED